MNIRASVRLNKNPEYKKGYEKKHIVCVLNINLMENAMSWVRNKNNELADYRKKIENIELTPVEIADLTYFQLIDFRDVQYDDAKKSTSNKLANIDNDTVLYLFCHGYIENTFDPDTALQINLKNAKTPEMEFSAKELFKFLKSHKLNKNHKFLKLAACYSDRFAQELSEVSKSYFTEMTIAGYHGELIVNQKNNFKYAGLVHESGYLIEEDPKQYSIIDKSKIEPFNEMVRFYRSHNWRYIFKKGALIESPLKKGEADLNGFTPIPEYIAKKHKKSKSVDSKDPKEEEKDTVNSYNVDSNKNKNRFLFHFKITDNKELATSSAVSIQAEINSTDKIKARNKRVLRL